MKNLTKKERLIFSTFSALFIVPELVWGMISKYWFFSIFGSWKNLEQNVAFLSDNTNAKLYTNILFLQILSLLVLLILATYKGKKLKFFTPIIVLLIALIGLGGIVLMYSYALSYVQYSIGL
ncbi:MAG: hypothetical protein WCT49_05760 [Candidatus Paceibacterota bacterium]|jgi:hypothetical protein|nr:hypothetical protein [Candidatus Paceibacterota bacterium]